MKSIIIFLILSLSIIFNLEAHTKNSSLNIQNNSSKVANTTIVNSNLNNVKPSLKADTKKTQPNDVQMSTTDTIAGIAAIFAFIALIISIITAVKTHNLANKDFLLTHRPFVWVENFGYLNNQNIIVNPINQVMIMLLNSPAKFHREFFEYYIIDNLNIKSIVETQEYLGQIRYPSEKSQYTNTSGKVTPQLTQGLNTNQELERKIRIDYSWLSSEKKYFFEAIWRFDKVSQTWKILTQTAD